MVSKSMLVDKETLADAKNGNLLAFEKIVAVYQKPILNYVYRLVKNRENAEDLTQETFIHLFTNVSRIDPEDNFRAWLYKIATNVVYDWWRKKKRTKEISLINFFSEDRQEGVSIDLLVDKLPSYDLNGIENAEDIARALEELRPMHQLMLLLFYYNDFTYKEMSEILNIPLWNVKTYLYQARKSLKEVLLKQGFKPTNLSPQQQYGLSF